MLTREDFDVAVKHALRHYTRVDLLLGSPLLEMRVGPGGGSKTADVAGLQQILANAAQTIFVTERDQKLLRVLELTYFRPAPKQEAVAERLGLSFSTYRRYLTAGTERLTEWLWYREQEALRDAEAPAELDAPPFAVAGQPTLATHVLHSTGVPRLSIVVLPFTNLSRGSEQEYFADGITDDLTTDLSRLADLLVISRNTAFTYKDKPVNANLIGKELCVRYVLEGSVRRSGNHIRVNAQLIDAETNVHLWAERFDGDAGDLFALQDEITSRIAVALDLELVESEAARPTVHPDVLDYILRGRAARLRPASRENRTEAIDMFERALALDQDSVAAQSWLAIELTARALDLMTTTAASDIARAEGFVERALARSHRSALAHFARAQVFRAQHRYDEAIPEYETAIVLSRNWGYAYSHVGWCKFMTGWIEELIPAQERAIRVSPRDPQIGLFYSRIGRAHLLQSRIEDAIIWCEKARNANPAAAIYHSFLASAHALKGNAERAAAEFAEARHLARDSRYSSIVCLRAAESWGVPKIRALFEATYLAGLRKAGMPEE